MYDPDTGLIHFGFREYDPTIGRFISPDPLGYAGGDVDLYGYCLDDPINFVDRLGLSETSEASEEDEEESTNDKEKKDSQDEKNNEQKSKKNDQDTKDDSQDGSYAVGAGVDLSGFGGEVGVSGKLAYFDKENAALLVEGRVGASNDSGIGLNVSAEKSTAQNAEEMEGSGTYARGGLNIPGKKVNAGYTKNFSKTSNSTAVDVGVGLKTSKYGLPVTNTGKTYTKTLVKFNPPFDEYAEQVDKNLARINKGRKAKPSIPPRTSVRW